jgi:hypothetical protein
MTDGETNTLAAHGLEEIFSSCAIVSVFLLWWEIVLGVTYLPYQLCRCAWLHRSVFGCGGKKGYVLLTYQPFELCCCVSFWILQEMVFGCTVSKKDSYLVSLRER